MLTLCNKQKACAFSNDQVAYSQFCGQVTRWIFHMFITLYLKRNQATHFMTRRSSVLIADLLLGHDSPDVQQGAPGALKRRLAATGCGFVYLLREASRP